MSVELAEGRSLEGYWDRSQEKGYSHWTRNEVSNQVQLAFRNHWEILCQFMESDMYGGGQRVLEVGSGQGSLSMYFADAGFDCTLMDSSSYVLAAAESLFMQNRLRAKFVQGDVMALPFAAGSFDLIFSIGLLEYIVNCQTTLQEQARALAPGGLLVAYVVPYYQQNIQHNYRWINNILKGYHNFFSHPSGEAMAPPPPKNDVASASFVRTFGKVGLTGVEASGAYPLPLISHAPEFPFSLMAPESEQAVVRHFREILDQRRSQHPSRHPWLCEEGYGQAFYVWGYKPK